MTAQKLTDNTYTNMFYKIKSNIRISVVALILNLISAPVILINMIIYLKAEEKYQAAYMLFQQGLLAENALPPYPNSPEIYIAVGVFATALHYGIYFLLQKFINVNIAYTLGYAFSFIANVYLTLWSVGRNDCQWNLTIKSLRKCWIIIE